MIFFFFYKNYNKIKLKVISSKIFNIVCF